MIYTGFSKADQRHLLDAFPLVVQIAQEYAFSEFGKNIPGLFQDSFEFLLDRLGEILHEYNQNSIRSSFIKYAEPRLRTALMRFDFQRFGF